MEEKYYTIVAKSKEEKCSLINDLTCWMGHIPNVPGRECFCKDNRNYSNTRVTFLLTDEEVNQLKNDNRVKSINLDKRFYEGMGDEIVTL